MSTAFPPISGEKAVKLFVSLGYCIARQRGSHIRLHHSFRKPLTIPNHALLGRGLLRKLLRDSELSLDEYRKILSSI